MLFTGKGLWRVLHQLITSGLGAHVALRVNYKAEPQQPMHSFE